MSDTANTAACDRNASARDRRILHNAGARHQRGWYLGKRWLGATPAAAVEALRPCERYRKDLVLVEVMPLYLVNRHKAARNFGVWPVNGAERLIVEGRDLDGVLEPNGYDHVVRVATRDDVERYGDA